VIRVFRFRALVMRVFGALGFMSLGFQGFRVHVIRVLRGLGFL
jgi:hypothetical protein